MCKCITNDSVNDVAHWCGTWNANKPLFGGKAKPIKMKTMDKKHDIEIQQMQTRTTV